MSRASESKRAALALDRILKRSGPTMSKAEREAMTLAISLLYARALDAEEE